VITSIVILTHNQLPLTDKCLQSIRQHTQDYELIVVDNGSTDGTVEYLSKQSDVIVHENKENLGFAKGCNQGIELSKGENILFLNNDTIVTEHWLENMLFVLYENERVGMVGPVTNYSSGHQCIPVTYSELSGLEKFARLHCQENAGCYTDVRRLVGFCLLAKRSLLDEIGSFDERFGLGNYEDDDLCLRALRAGFLLRVVNDSFIHHIGHATMNNLQEFNLAMLLHQNRQKAAEKWGDDIHQHIYKPEITVSLCMITRNAEETLRQSLVSIIDDVDEIIIIDMGSSDDTVEIAKNYTTHVFSFTGRDDPLGSRRYAFEQATKEYVIWLQQGEIFDSKMIRKLSGLKFSMDGSPDMVTLSDDVVMFRRDAGFRWQDEFLEGVKP
jgi:GT2 family glycosyltransferase